MDVVMVPADSGTLLSKEEELVHATRLNLQNLLSEGKQIPMALRMIPFI